jgi:drug/metabolite transporter (DMT)-like permease
MTAALGGLGAALVWSLGNLFATRAAHALGPVITLAWVMLVGLALLAVALPFGAAPTFSGSAIVWLAIGGIGNAVGLLLLYRALRLGAMGVVMPLVSTEGGLAALIAVLAGQPIEAVTAVAMLVVVAGVVMTSPRDGPDPADEALVAGVRGLARNDRRAAAIAGVAALSMSLSMYATGRAGSLVPAGWAVLPPRLIGVLVVTLPLLATGRLPWPRRSHLGWLCVAGACEVGGFLLYALGARASIPVAAVLSSLTGAMGVGWGRLAFGERLRPLQLAGVAVIFAGVATVSATSS